MTFCSVLTYSLWKFSSRFASAFLVLNVENIYFCKLCSEHSVIAFDGSERDCFHNSTSSVLNANRLQYPTTHINEFCWCNHEHRRGCHRNTRSNWWNTGYGITKPQVRFTNFSGSMTYYYVCISVCMCMHTISIYAFQVRTIKSNSVCIYIRIINIQKKGINIRPTDVMRGITNIKEKDCLRENLTDMN